MSQTASTAQILDVAAAAAHQLEAVGVVVHGMYHQQRGPVLIIDGPPPSLDGHVKRRSPNGGCSTRVLAAPFMGCQLEWSIEAPRFAREREQAVSHG